MFSYDIYSRGDSFNARGIVLIRRAGIVLMRGDSFNARGDSFNPRGIVLEERENVEIGREMKDMSEPRNEVRR